MAYSKEAVARVCHETLRAFCQTIGDKSLAPWEEAPEWQRASSLQAVEFGLRHPDATARDNHDAWVEAKRADGWRFGEVKDADLKTHPCLVSFDQLPPEQQAKDALIAAVVASLRGLLG
ncbi:RyR domain-containing protein [Urbifossiella limnaea]|uniref:RyR domain protein n=1 Tax=Urbifossiella limnaea TaxID=2528023 RepID=A0A517XWI9_9BACT|nr:RyR domain-containing protein [Urbifossiella limnaea]QDU21872.1 RyR domain protein [Urbifossiella limnaea]